MIDDPARTRAAEVTLAPLATTAEAQAFRALNEEWIARLFTLEDEDRRILSDPTSEIVARGGHVLIARVRGELVGCVALVAAGGGVYELSKMTVDPAWQGAGVGRAVVLAAIAYAREVGASALFLGSSTRLAAAGHLYESVGFRHVTRAELGPLPYRRADVFMRYELG